MTFLQTLAVSAGTAYSAFQSERYSDNFTSLSHLTSNLSRNHQHLVFSLISVGQPVDEAFQP